MSISSTLQINEYTSMLWTPRPIRRRDNCGWQTRCCACRGAEAGKTRLAVEAAAALRDEYRDGAWLVELTLIRPGQHHASKQRECGAAELTARSDQLNIRSMTSAPRRSSGTITFR